VSAAVRRGLLLPFLLVVLAVVVVGGLLVSTTLATVLYASCAVKPEQLRRFKHPDAVAAAFARWRMPIALSLVRWLGAAARPAHARAFVALMAANEIRVDWDGVSPIVGDEKLPGGPSVGPCQVYRATAKEEGAWAPPPDVAGDDAWERQVYATLANVESKCIDMGAETFGKKLRAARGDVADAIRRYNGAGHAAQVYRANAVAFADATWGAGSLAITADDEEAAA
jgi:hypothetical protein